MKKVGRPIEKVSTYRYSMYFDGDLKEFIKHESWKQKKSICQYLNDLVREDMDRSIEKSK